MSAALSEVQVVEILNTHLADIGIRHARLFFFEAENEDPVAWSLQAGMEGGMQNQRFPSREFPPAGLYADDELLNLIPLPLCHSYFRMKSLAMPLLRQAIWQPVRSLQDNLLQAKYGYSRQKAREEIIKFWSEYESKIKT